MHAANRWWATGDLGEEVAPGEIRPIGRIGRQVATGGETVSLEKIERAAAGLAGVRDAWDCAVPDAEWGNRILLFLAADRERDWRGKLKERLDPPEVPAEVRMVETVPRSDLGKVDPDRLFG